jgi:hypothetical protein
MSALTLSPDPLPRRFMSSADEQWLEGVGRFGKKPQSVLESSAVASDFLDEKIAQDKARVAYKTEHPDQKMPAMLSDREIEEKVNARLFEQKWKALCE